MKKFWDYFTSSLQRKTLVLVIAVLLPLLAAFVFYDALQQRAALIDSLHQKGATVALTGARTIAHIFEDAIATGRLTEEQVFDTNYQPISGTNPQKYHTFYDAFTDANLLSIEDASLADEDILYAVALDVNAYVPTHNSRYNKPLTGNYEEDLAGNRTKRIYTEAPIVAAGSSTQPILQQEYARDTGEYVYNVSVPIYVNGRHWGGYLIGFSFTRIDEIVAGATQRIAIAAVALIAAVGIALYFVIRSFTRPVLALRDVAAAVSGGNLEVQANEKSKDEVGALGRAFNHMVGRLRGMIQSEQEQRERLQQTNVEVERRAHAEQEQRERLQTTVRQYVGYMTEVARGNLAARLSLDGNGNNPDDPLLVLGRNLNDAVASLQKMTSQISSAAASLASATAEILAATTQQAAGVSEQSAAISQASTTIDEVRTIAEQTAQRAQGVTDMAQHTTEVSHAGQQAVTETIGGMAQVREKVESISRGILDLSKRTQAIGSIINTVNDIAIQSNMLALNASVEAARAGEAGKGFAVVAQEVRSLAEQSKAATDQVRQILSEIQRGVNAAVMATEEGTKMADTGVQLAGESGEALRKLAESITASTQAAMQIAAAAGQQVLGMEQIATAIQNIGQATVQNLASTHQTEKSAQDLSELAHSLTKTVGQYQL